MAEAERRRRGCLFWVGVVAACGGIALVVADFALRRYGEGRLAGLPAAVAVYGSSLDLESLCPPVPDAENGAILVMTASALLKSEFDIKTAADDFDWMAATVEVPTGKDRDPRHIAFVRLCVEANARPIEMFREAASRAAFRLPSGDDSIRGASETQKLARAAQAHARIALIDRDPQAAYDDVAATLTIAGGVGGYPTIVGRLVGIAIADLTSGILHDALAVAPPDAARRAALLAALDRCEAVPFTRTLEGERAFIFEGVGRVRAALARQSNMPQTWSDRVMARYLDLWIAWQLDLLQALIVDSRRPTWEWKLDPEPSSAGWTLEPGISFDLSSLRQREVESRATLAILRAAILRRTGDSGPLPIDPYTGTSLRERVDASGARTIWSVGMDRQDNGGAGDDIAVRVPR